MKKVPPGPPSPKNFWYSAWLSALFELGDNQAAHRSFLGERLAGAAVFSWFVVALIAMGVLMETIQVKTSSRIQFIDITARVRDAISKSRVSEGIAVVYVTHTTAGVTINEAADPSVVEDINRKLTQLVPHHDAYRHSEGNSDAHIKASIMGSSATLILSGGSPVLGTWQGVFFCEFDGPRSRRVLVKVVPA